MPRLQPHHSAHLLLALVACASLQPAVVLAQTAAAVPALQVSSPPAPQVPTRPPTADEAALLQVFGNRDGLGRLAQDFVQRMQADVRTKAIMDTSKMKPAYLASQLADQFCRVLNGPCTYDGETMKTAHAGLAIARKDFLATVEVLQAAMDAQGIPFAAQNRLLAQLAPMHRDIVNR